jgi:soluble lytic murein transglycosylase
VKRIGLLLLLALLLVGGLFLWRDHRDHRFDAEIRMAAREHQLPPALVKAIVWRESRFDPTARGRAGEIGLMQVTEIAAQEWADSQRLTNFVHDQILHPGTNTRAGCFYLAKVMRRYRATDDPVAFALADYNAGRTHVLRWMNSTNSVGARTNAQAFLAAMTFPGTRQYIESILGRSRRYEADFRARD